MIFAGVNKDAGRGVNVGIDFTGGNIVTIQTKYQRGAEDDAHEKEVMAVVKEVLGEKIFSYSVKQYDCVID